MDRILFGDNQFFAINHMSEEKARKQALRFNSTDKIMEVLDYVYEIGLRTFMCTTHDQISEVCDQLRENPYKYKEFKMYPCMPYAHKYNNMVAELGLISALKKILPGSFFGQITRAGVALTKRDYIEIMKMLIDTEMAMFKGINTEVIFIQNIVTDLLLGLGMNEFFLEFSDYIKNKYGAEAGFITMNLPKLKKVLIENGLDNPIICTSINEIGFRMAGGKEKYEKIISEGNARIIAMQVMAAGAIKPVNAIDYICGQENINSILFGASTKNHILDTKKTIELLDQRNK